MGSSTSKASTSNASTSKASTSEASTSEASTSEASISLTSTSLTSTSDASKSKASASLTCTTLDKLDIVNKWYEDQDKSEDDYNRVLKEANEIGGKILYNLDSRFRGVANDFFGYILEHARKICDDKYTITKEDRDELGVLIRRGFFHDQLPLSEWPKINPCSVFDDLYIDLTTNQINEKEFKTRISAVLVEVEKLVDEWYDTYMKYIMIQVFRTIYYS
jgi:hypothetical protein